jgi:fatty-acyl-CoA synthase
MYRTGGENVYPAEIEKVLANHPKIFNVSIIGVPDDKWGEAGMAFIILEDGENLTLDEVHTFLEGKVARYKFPTYVKFVDKLPMTTTGKIMKVKLKEKYGVRLDA